MNLIKHLHPVALSILFVINIVLLVWAIDPWQKDLPTKTLVLQDNPDIPQLPEDIKSSAQTSQQQEYELQDININPPVRENNVSSTWSLWIKDFDNNQDAIIFSDKLKIDKFRSYVSSKKDIWQVFIGPFASEEYMLSVQKKVLDRGFETVIVGYLF